MQYYLAMHAQSKHSKLSMRYSHTDGSLTFSVQMQVLLCYLSWLVGNILAKISFYSFWSPSTIGLVIPRFAVCIDLLMLEFAACIDLMMLCFAVYNDILKQQFSIRSMQTAISKPLVEGDQILSKMQMT